MMAPYSIWTLLMDALDMAPDVSPAEAISLVFHRIPTYQGEM